MPEKADQCRLKRLQRTPDLSGLKAREGQKQSRLSTNSARGEASMDQVGFFGSLTARSPQKPLPVLSQERRISARKGSHPATFPALGQGSKNGMEVLRVKAMDPEVAVIRNLTGA